MRVGLIKETLNYAIKSNVSLMLVGDTGIGKTEIPRQYAQENGYMLKYLNLGAEEVGDLRGLANFDVNPNGTQVTTFARPDWQQELIEFCTKNPDKIGIIFLDECNRCKQEVFQVIYPLILEKRIGQVQFPSNVYVMAASNPNTDSYNTAEVDDEAFKARFSYLKITPNVTDWANYAKSVDMDINLVSFFREHPQMLYGKHTEFSITKKPAPRLADMCAKFLTTDAPQYITDEVICGLIGLEAGHMLLKSLTEMEQAIKGIDVLNNYKQHRATMLKYCSTTDGRQDMINYTIESLQDESLKSHEWNDDQLSNVNDFICDLPKDSAYHILCELFQTKNGRLLDSKYKNLRDMIKSARGKV